MLDSFERNFTQRKFEEIAKSLDCEDRLEYFMSQFIKNFKYSKTSYALRFHGLYRARAEKFNSVNEACTYFDNIAKLGPPPKEHAREGRCNRLGSPLFYCSTDSGVPVFETRPNIGDYLVLTGYAPKNGQTFDVTLTAVGVRKILSVLEKRDAKHPFYKMFQGDLIYSKDASSLDILLDDFFSEWFITPVNNNNLFHYKLTSTYFKLLIKGLREDFICGLVYPSVESECTGLNIALEADVVKDNLFINKATLYRIEGKNNDTYILRVLKEIGNIHEDGKIIWSLAARANQFLTLSPSDPSPVISKPHS